MMNYESNAYETRMMEALTAAANSGILTLDELKRVPSLRDEIGVSVWEWLASVPLRQSRCMSMISAYGLDVQDLATKWYLRLFDPQRTRESDKPAMERILEMTMRTGAQSAVRYLMSSAENLCRDAIKPRKDVPTFVEIGDVVVAGDAADRPDAVALRRESSAAVLGCFSGDFLRDVTLLGSALGYPRQKLAAIILSGRSAALVANMIRTLNTQLDGRYESALAPLYKAAREYTVPAEYVQDPAALLARMYRCTTRSKREKFAARVMQAAA